MNVVVTWTFRKDFIKIFHTDVLIWAFCDKIRNTQLYNLDVPYKKFKISMNGVHVRWILILWEKGNMIPIFLVKKSDKKYGMNLISSQENKKIFSYKYDKIIDDIQSGNYTQL